MKQGRKFCALVIASVLIAIGMVAGTLAAVHGVEVDWLAGLLPVLATTYPAYLGANAVQKTAELKRKEPQ